MQLLVALPWTRLCDWLFFCHEWGMTDQELANRCNVNRVKLMEVQQGKRLVRAAEYYLEELLQALNNLRRLELMKKNEPKAQTVKQQLILLTFIRHGLLLEEEEMYFRVK